MRLSLFLAVIMSSLAVISVAQDKSAITTPADGARVFVTDSESWSVSGQSGGAGGIFAGSSAGGARPQTAEIIKTFGERCPEVKVNNKQERADYIVVLDHEGGKSFLAHKNKVAVFNRVSGDSIVSKSTLPLGGSVQEAGEAIAKDWLEHGAAIQAAAAAAPEKSVPAATPAAATSSTAKLQIESTPPGADIEIDGSFVGSTPSDVQVADGEHTVVVKKSGFKSWERKRKASAGSSVHVDAELEKANNPIAGGAAEVQKRALIFFHHTQAVAAITDIQTTAVDNEGSDWGSFKVCPSTKTPLEPAPKPFSALIL